jgi:heme/copper-type cytochrome/quinol oxidase subunit 3
MEENIEQKHLEESEDEKHLKLLSLFHYIVGGILVLFACMPLLHLSIGIAVMCGVFDNAANSNQVPPVFFGLIFAVMGGLFFIFGQAIAWATIFSGRQIKNRKNYMFSFIVACVMCMFMPFGIILGIFTIIVLSRESVKQLYEKTS